MGSCMQGKEQLSEDGGGPPRSEQEQLRPGAEGLEGMEEL